MQRRFARGHGIWNPTQEELRSGVSADGRSRMAENWVGQEAHPVCVHILESSTATLALKRVIEAPFPVLISTHEDVKGQYSTFLVTVLGYRHQIVRLDSLKRLNVRVTDL